MARTATPFVFIGLLALTSAVAAQEAQLPVPRPSVEPRTNLATIDEAIEAVREAADPVEVIRAFEAGRRIDANSTALYEACIRTMVERGQVDLAYRPAEEWVEIDPEQGLGWAVIAHQAAEANDPWRSVSAASKAAAYHGDEPFVLETVARVAAWYRWQRDRHGGNASVDGQVDALVDDLASNDVFSKAYREAEAFYEDLDERPGTAASEPYDREAARRAAREAVGRRYRYGDAPPSGDSGGGYPYFHGYDDAYPYFGDRPYDGRFYFDFFPPFGHGYYDYYPYRRHNYPRYHHHRFYPYPHYRDRYERNPYRQRFPHERPPWPRYRYYELRRRLYRQPVQPGSRRPDRDRPPRAIRPVEPPGRRLSTTPPAAPKHRDANKLEAVHQLRRRHQR
ncbi:MAG: hypothetical protein ACOC95_03610 [Planctomycetota bacterium]